MASVVMVHGIANQYLGEQQLHAAWYPALRDGLLRADSDLPDPQSCVCAFYGDVFRPAGHLGGGGRIEPEDVENATEDEMRLVQEIWNAATEADANVPGPQEYGDTLVRVPVIVQRALNALARSRYCADYTPLQLFGDLKQVVLYLNDSEIRQRVLDRILAKIAPDTRVVIGHSLGSVVAYEALCRKPENVAGFVTLGSPLGIRNVVFDKLQPPPDAMGVGHWPGSTQFWVNIADSGDIVAAQKRLAPLFGNQVEDLPVCNGWDAHNSERYLSSIQAGQAIARAFSVGS